MRFIAREPKTISQLAAALELSPPSVHTHINDMMKSELLRESEEWEKKFLAERYYEPNFPVFRAEECAEFKALCDEMSKELVAMFERKSKKWNAPFVKPVFQNRAGNCRTSRNVCTQTCSEAHAQCLSSVDFSPRAKNIKMALHGFLGRGIGNLRREEVRPLNRPGFRN